MTTDELAIPETDEDKLAKLETDEDKLATQETDGLETSLIVKTWQEKDIRFHLLKTPIGYVGGHYCGYCVFPKRPVIEQGYCGLLTYVPIHGGITYAKETREGKMVYGFDCAHAGDETDPRCKDDLWLTHEVETMALAILIAAKCEEAYLLAEDNEAKAAVIQAFLDKTVDVLERDLEVTDNFGVMMNMLCGRL